MAKRKRLTPAQPGYLDGPAGPPGPAPIARVAGDAATQAALEELGGALQAARAEGRMIECLPLDAVDDSHLLRDRMVQDVDEMTALTDSLRARGQQTAIEVVRLPGEGPGYGLISGWRRLTALRRLHHDTGEDRFATVQARIVAPQTAQAAYVAMVEENEIRADLSFYERARIALRAMREGVYAGKKEALQGLFGSTTRSRRSKIGSFIALVEAFDSDLRHPTAISEKLGLGLARELLRDPGFVSKVRSSLESHPDRTAAEEIRLLVAAVTPPPRSPAVDVDQDAGRLRPVTRDQAAPGIALSFFPDSGRIELKGPKVDGDLAAALKDWLTGR
jgi:hypothetical protein